MLNLNGTSTFERAIVPVAVCLITLYLGCAGSGGQAGTERDDYSRISQIDPGMESLPAGMVRFALELSPGTRDAVYVSINDADGQPGWIRVFRGTDRIYLKGRCEIEDCGRQAAVCGVAMPMIQQIGRSASSGGVEVIWDGTTSVIDSTSGCEIRQASPEGKYRARFCYASEAEFEPTNDPRQPISGRLIQPTCVEQIFILPTSEVSLRL